MRSSNTDEVVVVGAGIVGICCALSLVEKGVAVTMIDRGQPAQGASSGNAGVVSPWSNVPQCLPGVWKKVPKWLLDPDGPVSIPPRHLARALPWSLRFLRNAQLNKATEISDAMAELNTSSIDLYRSHLRGTGEEHLLRDSMYVHVFRDKAAANLDGVAWQLRARHGTPVEVISEDDLRALEPALSPDYKAAILIREQARALSPGRLGGALARKFESMGGRLLQGAVQRLVPIEPATWRLETEFGEFSAERVVLAAGAWSARFLEPLGVKLPLAAERGYHLTFKNPGITLNNSVMETSRMFVCSSMENGVRSAGTSEIADLDASPNFKRARRLKALTKSLIPDMNTQDTEEWMGVRPTLPEQLTLHWRGGWVCRLVRGVRSLSLGDEHGASDWSPCCGLDYRYAGQR